MVRVGLTVVVLVEEPPAPPKPLPPAPPKPPAPPWAVMVLVDEPPWPPVALEVPPVALPPVNVLSPVLLELSAELSTVRFRFGVELEPDEPPPTTITVALGTVWLLLLVWSPPL